MKRNLSIGVIIPTFNASQHIARCLYPFISSPLKPQVLVVDSSSTDGTVDLARSSGAEVVIIDKAAFNHGNTREMARKRLNTDIVVMVTHDAYALNQSMLEKLIAPIEEGKASIAYGRQIPHDGAHYLEAYARAFNYPSKSHLRSLDDLPTYGAYTFFCSNSFAAYSNRSLDEIGGFPTTSFGEDTIATALLLRRGKKIAYVAEAVAKHSHHFSLWEEFQRHRCIGQMRNAHAALFACKDGDSKRGKEFATQLIRQLFQERPFLIPYALLHLGAKWFGYKLGKSNESRKGITNSV